MSEMYGVAEALIITVEGKPLVKGMFSFGVARTSSTIEHVIELSVRLLHV